MNLKIFNLDISVEKLIVEPAWMRVGEGVKRNFGNPLMKM